jgi:hypothetical protein
MHLRLCKIVVLSVQPMMEVLWGVVDGNERAARWVSALGSAAHALPSPALPLSPPSMHRHAFSHFDFFFELLYQRVLADVVWLLGRQLRVASLAPRRCLSLCLALRLARPLLLWLQLFMRMRADRRRYNRLWLWRLILSRQRAEDAVRKAHLGDGTNGRRRLRLRLLLLLLSARLLCVAVGSAHEQKCEKESKQWNARCAHGDDGNGRVSGSEGKMGRGRAATRNSNSSSGADKGAARGDDTSKPLAAPAAQQHN